MGLGKKTRRMKETSDRPRIILLGAGLETGNLGVSALTAASVKCILEACPEATIQQLEGDPRGAGEYDSLRLASGKQVPLPRIGVRRNKTLWRRNHLLRLLFEAWVGRLLPVASWRQVWYRRNPYLRAVAEARCVADITGGDSFSDIYGVRRLVMSSLEKWLVLAAGTELVLLPQTYGPFRRRLSRWVARTTVRRASKVLSRDAEGLKEVHRLMGRRRMRGGVGFCPDVAFVLDAIAPAEIRTIPGPLPAATASVRGKDEEEDREMLIGLNVSGLLYRGGYTRRNMFNLRVDYPELMQRLVQTLLARDGVRVLLVPHVFPPPALAVESDAEACRQVRESISERYRERVYCLEGRYDQNEIKYIIGLCNFFVGSRMHACIAAASQGITTVPLAYSDKFKGVFDTIDSGELVGDLRELTIDEAIRHVMQVWERRTVMARHLEEVIPRVQRTVKAAYTAIFSPEGKPSPSPEAVGVG